MRESEDPANHRWARKVSQRFVWECPQYKPDIQSEALLGLVKAEQHPLCPGPEEFQAFAYPFVKRAITDFLRKSRRHRWGSCDLDDIVDPRNPGIDEWPQTRLSVSQRLRAMHRQVFLAVYGESSCRTLHAVALEIGLSLDQVKRLHAAAMETLRDLPCIYQLA